MTERSPENLLSRHTFPVWSVIALLSLVVHLVLPQDASHMLAAALLSLIAGVYLGFAFLDGRMSRILVEAAVAVAFMGFAVWALATAPMLIPLGYMAHAAWDFLHHVRFFKVKMPGWYIPACVVVDVIVGLGLWLIWGLLQ